MAAAGRKLPLELRIKATEGRQELRCHTFNKGGKENLEPLSRVSQPKSLSSDVQFEVSEREKTASKVSNEAI